MDHREGHPVSRAWPQFVEGPAVLRRRIPLVRGEPVTGMYAIELEQHPIPRRLRDDRGRRDGEVDAVALVERILRNRYAGHRARVHEEMLRRTRQAFDRAT